MTPSDRPRKKILLVDDSNTVLMIVKMVLGAGAYELLEARNGREAVELAVAEKPDLILMDVVMPEMGGFEACEQLRRLPETSAIPIVMVTTRGEPHNIEAGYQAGATEYVTKPFNGPELLAVLRNHLGE